MTIKVHSSVDIYERDGKETRFPNDHPLHVSSHWNRREFVVLQLHDEVTIAVAASDLIAAVKNAQNTGRF